MLSTSNDMTPSHLAQWPSWPEYGLVDDLLPFLSRWAAEGQQVALATLMEITGSSPRPLGSEMAIAANGSVAGYVSGGCVEAEVAREALGVLANGKPLWLDYGEGSPNFDIQLTCGGRIGIFVREIRDLASYVAQRKAAFDARRVSTVVTDVRDGSMNVVQGETWPETGMFARPHVPQTRLVIVGGDPVALALSRLAPQFGLATMLLRPMGPERPPLELDVSRYDRRRLETALGDLVLDGWTAVYSLTHDSHDDLLVARRALDSAAFCVGVLGSRRKIAARMRALQREGIGSESLRRLHLPAGLAIGARTPNEIALSILAQVVSMRPPPLTAGFG